MCSGVVSGNQDRWLERRQKKAMQVGVYVKEKKKREVWRKRLDVSAGTRLDRTRKLEHGTRWRKSRKTHNTAGKKRK